MTGLFLKVLNMSITAGWFILAILPVRLLLKKAPKRFACILWLLAAVRLICPVSAESLFSLIPGADTISSDIELAASPAVHWFNPLVWAAFILFSRDLEGACDEKVIRTFDESGKKEYSRALLSCAQNCRPVFFCPPAFGEVGVKERILSVLRYRRPSRMTVLLAAGACLALAVCFLTDPYALYIPEAGASMESEAEITGTEGAAGNASPSPAGSDNGGSCRIFRSYTMDNEKYINKTMKDSSLRKCKVGESRRLRPIPSKS